jgi:hypothetical protein
MIKKALTMRLFVLTFISFAVLTNFVTSEILVRCTTNNSNAKRIFERRTVSFNAIKNDVETCRDENPEISLFKACCEKKELIADTYIVMRLDQLTDNDVKDKETFDRVVTNIIDDLCISLEKEYSTGSNNLDENHRKSKNNAIIVWFCVITFAAIIGAVIWYLNKDKKSNNPTNINQKPEYAQYHSPYYVPNASSPYSSPPYQRNNWPSHPLQYPMTPIQQYQQPSPQQEGQYNLK